MEYRGEGLEVHILVHKLLGFVLFVLKLFSHLFIYFSCTGSFLLHEGFLWLQQAGATLQCTGFSLQWLLLLPSMGL